MEEKKKKTSWCPYFISPADDMCNLFMGTTPLRYLRLCWCLIVALDDQRHERMIKIQLQVILDTYDVIFYSTKSSKPSKHFSPTVVMYLSIKLFVFSPLLSLPFFSPPRPFSFSLILSLTLSIYTCLPNHPRHQL